jgi:hypothetical protein
MEVSGLTLRLGRFTPRENVLGTHIPSLYRLSYPYFCVREDTSQYRPGHRLSWPRTLTLKYIKFTYFLILRGQILFVFLCFIDLFVVGQKRCIKATILFTMPITGGCLRYSCLSVGSLDINITSKSRTFVRRVFNRISPKRSGRHWSG